MDGSQLGTIQNQQYILVAFILNVCVQLFREWRNHKWQEDEVLRQQKATVEHKQFVTTKLDQQTQAVNSKVDQQTVELKEEINNTVLKRLSEIGKRFDDLVPEEESRDTQ